MAFLATLNGSLDGTFDPVAGRKGRRKHPSAAPFDPLALGDDLLLWWDPTTLTAGAVSTWVDRKASATLIPGGTGSPSYDGSMVAITATAFLFGNNAWNFSAPFELWQVVDQTEAAGSTSTTSAAFGSVALLYTPPLGGQSSAAVGANSLFGGDDYHGVHVIRWQIADGAQCGWLDRKMGIPATVGYSNPLLPASFYVGANTSGADLWKGRVGDLIATKPLSSSEAIAMWTFLMRRAGI